MKRAVQIVRGSLVSLLAATGLLAFAAGTGRAEDNTTVVINGVVSNNAGANFVVGDTGVNNWLIITNAGQLVNVATGTIGNAAAADNNGAVVTGSGSVWTNSGTLTVGYDGSGNRLTIDGGRVYSATFIVAGHYDFTGGCSNNTVHILNGGRLYSAGAWIAYDNNDPNNNNNSVTVTGSNSLWDLGGGDLLIAEGRGHTNLLIVDGGMVTNVRDTIICPTYSGQGKTANGIIITNGGRFYSTGLLTIAADNQNCDHYNKLIVSGPGSVLRCGGSVSVADSSRDSDNSLLVADCGAIYGAGGRVGVGTGGFGGPNDGNSARLIGGGVWDVGASLSVGNSGGSNNTLTNQGGVLQFTTASPAITINAPGNGNAVVMAGGSLSYRGIQSGTLPDLTNNWGTNGLGLFTWTGANRFRLVNCSATNSLATPYVFADSLGPTNYAGLELVEGTNAIRGPGLTFASGSLLVVSNSVTSIDGGCTLAGGMTVNWHGTSSLVAVNGTLTVSGINTFTVSGVPLEILPMTLFTSASIGDSGGWVVYPGQYRVIRSGTNLRLSRTSGTVMVVR